MIFLLSGLLILQGCGGDSKSSGNNGGVIIPEGNCIIYFLDGSNNLVSEARDVTFYRTDTVGKSYVAAREFFDGTTKSGLSNKLGGTKLIGFSSPNNFTVSAEWNSLDAATQTAIKSALRKIIEPYINNTFVNVAAATGTISVSITCPKNDSTTATVQISELLGQRSSVDDLIAKVTDILKYPTPSVLIYWNCRSPFIVGDTVTPVLNKITGVLKVDVTNAARTDFTAGEKESIRETYINCVRAPVGTVEIYLNGVKQ